MCRIWARAVISDNHMENLKTMHIYQSSYCHLFWGLVIKLSMLPEYKEDDEKTGF